MKSIGGTPFDAPLYGADRKHGTYFNDCKALEVRVVVSNEVAGLLPPQLSMPKGPPIGLIGVASYGSSNVGPYLEQYSGIQACDRSGTVGYYIPYIYVTTNDAALASGREALGAPKKLGHISLVREGDLIQGVLERPLGKRLLTVTAQPNLRFDRSDVSISPSETVFYSVRHLPPVSEAEAGSVTQLVKWRTQRTLKQDSFGAEMAFTGPIALTYDSPSVIDPIFKLGIDEVVMATYQEFDCRLAAIGIV
ncbi:acetoacetate decarboxylase family protein [Bradyrhizobium sp. 83012]|uniref:Acetoacetate decarboxylase family protein n=2 Tax=Bradyrhizobium aeschynomenes TaxID=2734909 RepID=A0ABX2CQV4_9BRAD|nr:acetoacetate decarboxylase family protein [Bradyrhizobium aeschynomenes]NPU69712.1 acetoacetate decarboxylase family protein [Bradyrhizobium aeschynomenes]NPV24653.1 acetoacetate decarboxylase family protein [Bradyrhizobium aeschynomenes]